MAAGMFPHHDFASRKTDPFGIDNFIGLAHLKKPVLVNTRFMGKGIPPHNRFVRLHDKAG